MASEEIPEVIHVSVRLREGTTVVGMVTSATTQSAMYIVEVYTQSPQSEYENTGM